MYVSVCANNREAKELPNMEDNMKVAKMKPCGMSSPFGLKAGVHRNTKVYIEPSNKDCIAPNNAIFSSVFTQKKKLLGPNLEGRMICMHNYKIATLDSSCFSCICMREREGGERDLMQLQQQHP